MMRIAVVTLFPEMFSALTEQGVVGRAIQESRAIQLDFFNPRDYSQLAHRRVDDRPYGGGPGMVMQYEPLAAAIAASKASLGQDTRVAYLTPQGKTLRQTDVVQLAQQKTLILLAGRYEGVDERVLKACVDEQWSIGDYVVSGGELPAMVLIDAVARCLPGVLGHEQAAAQDSFSEGLLDCPHYTWPREIDNMQVPEVLLQGDHEKIRRWRLKQALGQTWLRRPDLLVLKQLTAEEQALLKEFKNDLES